MLTKTDIDFYCLVNAYRNNGKCGLSYKGTDDNNCICKNCNFGKRKHPTPEQFKEEYGEEWTGAVYYHCTNNDCDSDCDARIWSTEVYGCLSEPIIICACTPFGVPDKDWRPE